MNEGGRAVQVSPLAGHSWRAGRPRAPSRRQRHPPASCQGAVALSGGPSSAAACRRRSRCMLSCSGQKCARRLASMPQHCLAGPVLRCASHFGVQTVAVDTNGAGDSFATAYMVALALRDPHPGATANWAASRTVLSPQVHASTRVSHRSGQVARQHSCACIRR